MSTVKDRLGALRSVPLPLGIPPVVVATSLFYSVTERARRARRDGERGAVSIEQAIITIAVIAFALLIMGTIWITVKSLNGQIDQAPAVPGVSAGPGKG
jgi:ABC-type Fe3+ transport system permease subunit